MHSDGGAGSGKASVGASNSAQWTMVVCLTVVSMLAYIDKNMLTLLVGAVKADLGLTDTQVGVVVGAAFAVANLAVSVPAGWLADRVSRRAIVGVGVAFWSVMAAACGMAQNFFQLFLARAGVGLGEGALPPAAYSLIRDGVAQEARGRAYAVFGMAASVGSGLSLVLGGAMIAAIASSGVRELPLLGPVHSWQIALLVVALAGLPLALLPLMFREPARPQLAQSDATFASAFRVMRKHGVVLSLLMAFSVLHAMLTGALSIWLPALIGRNYGLQPQEIGPQLGLLLMVCAPIGLGLAGVLMDRSKKNGVAGAAAVAVGVSGVLLAAATLAPLAPNIETFWIIEAFIILSSTTFLPITSTVVSHVAPTHAIGKTMSLYLLVQGLLGPGLSPVLVAMVSDRLGGAANPSALATALSATSALYGVMALVAAAALFGVARRRYAVEEGS